MCGICGILNYKENRPVDEREIRQMCQALKHRGPDHEGVYINKNIGFGHRRLSIIDLNTGDQPIFNEDKSVVVISNGEIYNFGELKKRLIANGHKFRTDSDTEVIVHLYEEFGEKFITKLVGMFAIALWDANKRLLFLIRDRMGQKPLFYYQGQNSFIFASEIKSLLEYFKTNNIQAEINYSSIDRYLSYQFIPAPETIYKNIHKVLPAYFLVVSKDNMRSEKYWEIEKKKDKVCHFDFYKENLQKLMEDSIKLRMISDVPLGAFLSGGLDSGVIVALMSKLSSLPVKTFSIGFKNQSFNELPYAREISKRFNTDHYEFCVDYDNVEELIYKIAWHFDEPFADSSAIPTYFVSKMARDFVTVALSGDGGDELFAGYNRYLAKKVSNYYKIIPEWIREKVFRNILNRFPEGHTYYANSTTKKLKLFIDFAEREKKEGFAGWYFPFSYYEKEQLYSEKFKSLIGSESSPHNFLLEQLKECDFDDDITKMQWIDAKTYLPDDILTKVDRMSMAVALEARSPFLDHRLVEFIFSVPVSFKLKGFNTKYILKCIAGELLPKDIINRKKHGFVVPIADWIRGDLKNFIEEHLLSANSFVSELFNIKYVERMLAEHNSKKFDHGYRIWSLLMLEIWYRVYMNEKKLKV